MQRGHVLRQVDGTLHQGVDGFCAKVLTPCTKALTQTLFGSIVSVSRDDSPRNSFAASSGLVDMELVNVSTPSCKTCF